MQEGIFVEIHGVQQWATITLDGIVVTEFVLQRLHADRVVVAGFSGDRS